MADDHIPLANLRRALVIKLRHHGDVLLASPVFATLKRVAPQCEVDALVYADTAPMLEGHPAIRATAPDRPRLEAAGPAAAGRAPNGQLLAQLRARRYDLVVHLSEHTRGAWLTRLLRPRWSVAPTQPDAGFWRAQFHAISIRRQSHPLRHTVETNLDALRRSASARRRRRRAVTLVPGAAAEARVDALLAQHGLAPRRLHPPAPGLALAVQVLAGRARRGCCCDALAERGLPLVLDLRAGRAGARR